MIKYRNTRAFNGGRTLLFYYAIKAWPIGKRDTSENGFYHLAVITLLCEACARGGRCPECQVTALQAGNATMIPLTPSPPTSTPTHHFLVPFNFSACCVYWKIMIALFWMGGFDWRVIEDKFQGVDNWVIITYVIFKGLFKLLKFVSINKIEISKNTQKLFWRHLHG